ncbi:MAG: polysaccharide deacetylase family protein [Deltaproteobacteria bacterium]|nr:polysaccharide deacetylase family protein [Deltaproteobacteria bacterium]
MPFGVRIKVVFIILFYFLLLSVSAVFVLFVCPFCFLITLFLIVSGLYALFVFYPKFDPTGFSLIRLKGGSKKIALTFDDGPDPVVTPMILDILKSYSLKATFFCLGFKAKQYPEIIERIRNEGHTLANHGYSHAKLHNKNTDFIKSEIERAEKVLEPLTLLSGKKLFRAPHGFKNFTLIKVLRQNNYILAGWSRGIWDSDGSDADILMKRALNYLEDGVIYLFHDGRDDIGKGINTVEFLKRFIENVTERGYVITNNLFE